MSFWMWTIRNMISIACGTYNVRKFWTRRTSGSVRWWTIAWKYAYKNLTLQSGSPTRLVVMNVRSSARDRSSRLDYWTLNSRNINSMFAESGWFMWRRSQISTFAYLCTWLMGIPAAIHKCSAQVHTIPCLTSDGLAWPITPVIVVLQTQRLAYGFDFVQSFAAAIFEFSTWYRWNKTLPFIIKSS